MSVARYCPLSALLVSVAAILAVPALAQPRGPGKFVLLPLKIIPLQGVNPDKWDNSLAFTHDTGEFPLMENGKQIGTRHGSCAGLVWKLEARRTLPDGRACSVTMRWETSEPPRELPWGAKLRVSLKGAATGDPPLEAGPVGGHGWVQGTDHEAWIGHTGGKFVGSAEAAGEFTLDNELGSTIQVYGGGSTWVGVPIDKSFGYSVFWKYKWVPGENPKPPVEKPTPQSQTLTARPYWAGPGTTVDVDLLGDAQIPDPKIDFGPGIEQYAAPQNVQVQDSTRPNLTAVGYRCHLRLRPDVRLGERTVTVTGSDGTVSKASFLVQPLVLVLDIDGLRHDVLQQCLTGEPVATSNTQPVAQSLHRIFGDRVGPRQDGELRLTQFEHGFVLDDAITVFPSYTFPAQASFIMGSEPGVHGIPGNAIFDRMTKINHGFDGSESPVYFMNDAMNVYEKGLANDLLEGPSVYDSLRQAGTPQTSLSVFHQYHAGQVAGEFLRPDVIDQGLFLPAGTTNQYDRNACEALEGRLARLPTLSSTTLPKLKEWPSVIWLYLPGVDHFAHAAEHIPGLSQLPDVLRRALQMDTPTKQLASYVNSVDTQLSGILNSLGKCPGAIVMVVSDHGHTDIRDAHDISWDHLQRVLGDEYNVWQALWNIDKCDVVARLNSGVAHVYVNNVSHKQNARCGEHWAEKPSFERVLEVAKRFDLYKDMAIPGLPKGSNPNFDMVLVRNAERDGWKGPYYVYSLGQGGEVEDIRTYLRRTNNAFGVRLGWSNTPQDIDFIADRLTCMSCERSGDVVVLPYYAPPMRLRKPGEVYFHFTGGAYASQHGSMSMDDMNMSFAVAQPGGADPENLLTVLRTAIAHPARPRILDVSSVAAAFCGVSFRGADHPAAATGTTPPVVNGKPSDRQDGKKEPPVVDLDKQTQPQGPLSELDRLAQSAGTVQVTPEARKQARQARDLANDLAVEGKWAEAEAAWLKTVQLDPTESAWWNNLGNAYMSQEKWPQAETAFRVVVRLEPEEGWSHMGLANVLIRAGKKQEAIKELQEAKRLGDEDAQEMLDELEQE